MFLASLRNRSNTASDRSCGYSFFRLPRSSFFQRKMLRFFDFRRKNFDYLFVTAQPNTSPIAPAMRSKSETVRAPVNTACGSLFTRFP